MTIPSILAQASCVALSCLLSACMTVPATTTEKPTAPIQPNTSLPEAVKGRISASTTDGEGISRPFYGNFELALDPPNGDSGQLMLLSPVGSTVAILGWTKTSAILRRPQGGVEMYASLQDMLQQTIGIALTSSMLRNWLVGSPIDNVPVQSLGPLHFSQLGWDINYTMNEASQRPKLITLKRKASADYPQADMKLVIDEVTP